MDGWDAVDAADDWDAWDDDTLMPLDMLERLEAIAEAMDDWD